MKKTIFKSALVLLVAAAMVSCNNNRAFTEMSIAPLAVTFNASDNLSRDILLINPGGDWEVTPVEEWIHVTKGDGRFTVTVDDWDGEAAREGAVSVVMHNGYKSLKVTQRAGGAGGTASAITIDGKFDDWTALVAESYGAPDAELSAIREIKVRAESSHLYVYMNIDYTKISTVEEGADPWDGYTPVQFYFDTDNDAATGGFVGDWEINGTDFMLEGAIFEESAPIQYIPTAFSWGGEPGGTGWDWTEMGAFETVLSNVVLDGDTVYVEIGFPRFSMPFDLGSKILMGVGVQVNWNNVGVIPNAPAVENNGVPAPMLMVSVPAM